MVYSSYHATSYYNKLLYYMPSSITLYCLGVIFFHISKLLSNIDIKSFQGQCDRYHTKHYQKKYAQCCLLNAFIKNDNINNGIDQFSKNAWAYDKKVIGAVC